MSLSISLTGNLLSIDTEKNKGGARSRDEQKDEGQRSDWCVWGDLCHLGPLPAPWPGESRMNGGPQDAPFGSPHPHPHLPPWSSGQGGCSLSLEWGGVVSRAWRCISLQLSDSVCLCGYLPPAMVLLWIAGHHGLTAQPYLPSPSCLSLLCWDLPGAYRPAFPGNLMCVPGIQCVMTCISPWAQDFTASVRRYLPALLHSVRLSCHKHV